MATIDQGLETETFGNYIGGQWVPAADGGTFESRNPAHRTEVVGRFAASGQEEVAAALDAAQAAARQWARTPPGERAAILQRAAAWLEDRAAAIAREITREEGKPLREAKAEVLRTAEHLRFYAALGHLLNGETYPSGDPRLVLYTERVPLGVVSVITPWNFPMSIPGRKIAPALAAGNTVIFKPASETPLTAVRLTQAFEAAGLPAGVLNLVTGAPRQLGARLVADPAVAGVSFTGSTAAGFAIQKQVGPTCRVQLEMGGKNAVVVLADADPAKAVRLAVQGGYNLAGQACTGTSRLVVEAPVYPAVVELLRQAANRLRVGDGLDPAVEMGPLVNAAQEAQVLAAVEQGRQQGGRWVTGGAKLRGPEYDDGYFVSPAVFDEVDPASPLAQEEIFGPVLAVIPVRDLDHALEVVNGVRYGLAAAICTNDLARASRFVREVEAGMVKVNRTTTGVAMNAPFGGWKDSSTATFREEGMEALQFFSKTKTVFWGAE